MSYSSLYMTPQTGGIWRLFNFISLFEIRACFPLDPIVTWEDGSIGLQFYDYQTRNTFLQLKSKPSSPECVIELDVICERSLILCYYVHLSKTFDIS